MSSASSALSAVRLPLALALMLTAGSTCARATGFADPTSIDLAVAAFTGAAVGTPGGAALPVDRRLRLAACSAPLAVAWHGERHEAVLVQCPDAGWHVFVAVRGASLAPAVIAVSRGEEVTVAITGDGFSVSQSGEALENGAVGDWIRINPVKDARGTSAPIRAQVIRPGLVSVLLP